MSCDCHKRVKNPKFVFVKRVIKRMFSTKKAPDSLDQMVQEINMGCNGVPIRVNPLYAQSADGTWWKLVVSDEGVGSWVEVDENCDEVA